MKKEIYLYLENESAFLGTVFVDDVRGKEAYSFEYSQYALEHNLANILVDDEISFVIGRQFKSDSSSPYRFLKDLSPDRWGRNLLKRKYGLKELNFSEYLLNVSDVSRMGAIRIKLSKDGPFVLNDDSVPPFKYLNSLEQAAYNFELFGKDDDWEILLSPGSSLGGARPKATIYDNDGQIFLAKFGHKNDDYDVSKIEYMTYLLAKRVGIDISESKLIEIGPNRSVFLTKRFDRDKEKRYHYVSFMTLLGAEEGESSNYSYLDVVEVLNRFSASPKEDARELFKRLAFYILVHNYDDHLRNIGLLLKDGEYHLSPCFDVNITLFSSHLTLTIDGSEDYSLSNLLRYSKFFNYKEDEASKLIQEMKDIISNSVRKIANELKVDKSLFSKMSFLTNI